MSAMIEGWRSLRQQLRDNPRLRLGAWAIAAILAFYGWLLLGDAIDALRQDVNAEQNRLAKMRALAGQDIWRERAQQAAALKTSLLTELPEAQTPGLAQAELQTRLRTLLQDFGDAVNVEVAAPSAVEGAPGWIRIPATLSTSRLDFERIKRIVQAIEAQPALLRIDSLAIRNRSDTTQLTLTLQAFYQQAPEVADAP